MELTKEQLKKTEHLMLKQRENQQYQTIVL